MAQCLRIIPVLLYIRCFEDKGKALHGECTHTHTLSLRLSEVGIWEQVKRGECRGGRPGCWAAGLCLSLLLLRPHAADEEDSYLLELLWSSGLVPVPTLQQQLAVKLFI